MDVARILREIWRHPFWLLAGVVVAAALALTTTYRVGLSPPTLQEKGIEFGAASSQILVDSRTSALTQFGAEGDPFDPLARRADVYGRLLTSTPLKRAIAREAGLPHTTITAQPPTSDETAGSRESTATERANQLLGESSSYRVSFDTQPGLPVIEVFAEAPTAAAAIKLANAPAPVLQRYIAQISRDRPSQQWIRASQLGGARGGLVNQGASRTTAILTFAAALLLACFLIVAVSAVIRDWRRAAAVERGDVHWRGLDESFETWAEPRTARGDYADGDVVDGDVEERRAVRADIVRPATWEKMAERWGER